MSQFKVNGVVERTHTKTKTTKFGDKIINYAVVDGQEFSTGFKKVFSDGEMVNAVVEFKFGEYQLVEGVSPTTQPMLGSQPAPAAVGKKQFGGGGGGGYQKSTFPVAPTDGQMSIIRQNSMNRAVEILDNWTAEDKNGNVLFEPTTQEEYLRKLLEVALTITDFNSGQDIMQMQASQAQLQAVKA
jgi:hypothetical protein